MCSTRYAMRSSRYAICSTGSRGASAVHQSVVPTTPVEYRGQPQPSPVVECVSWLLDLTNQERGQFGLVISRGVGGRVVDADGPVDSCYVLGVSPATYR